MRSVVDRFAQIEPVVLLAIDGYRYGEKVVDKRADVAAIEAALPSLRHTVHVSYLGDGTDDWTASARGSRTARVRSGAVRPSALRALQLGHHRSLPKAIVHGHGGITVEHLKTTALHHDLRAGDRFFWFTTTGWMMWNYLMSGLLVGATIVLFDGDPGVPDLGTLWRLAADTGVDVFGVSAPFLMSCRKAGVVPPVHRIRSGRFDRRAVAPRRIPLGARCRRRRRAVAVGEWWYRRVRGVRGRGAAAPGARGRDHLPVARVRGRGVRRRRQDLPAGRAGRAGGHRADAVDAGRVLG